MPTLTAVPDDAPPSDQDETLPGEVLESGFRFRRAREVPEGRLSEDARKRVIEKMDSVDEARLRAARDGHTAYIG